MCIQEMIAKIIFINVSTKVKWIILVTSWFYHFTNCKVKINFQTSYTSASKVLRFKLTLSLSRQQLIHWRTPQWWNTVPPLSKLVEIPLRYLITNAIFTDSLKRRRIISASCKSSYQKSVEEVHIISHWLLKQKMRIVSSLPLTSKLLENNTFLKVEI